VNAVVVADGLTKRYRRVTALDGVGFELRANTVHGLLGRNGAGKTTLMHLLAGQQRPTSGAARTFGADPFENAAVLRRICFVKESQRYPDQFRVRHVLENSRRLMPRWNERFARSLAADFDLPSGRLVKKLSRGMLSALGVVVGLASRAPLTFFDEPYLGLDAAARHLFYDRLLADYADHPRTVVLSTHLINEVADLLEHVVLLDRGRVMLDEPAESLRGQVVMVTGPAAAVDELIAGGSELHRERLGGVARATVRGPVEPRRATALGVELEPVPLQQLIVRLTTHELEKESAR
jgi:ABC-2 type transport system ATP-binding protein